jgi:hypothetical protein
MRHRRAVKIKSIIICTPINRAFKTPHIKFIEIQEHDSLKDLKQHTRMDHILFMSLC